MAKYKVKVKGLELIVRAKLSSKEKVNARQLCFFSGKNLGGLLKAELIKNNLIEYRGPVGVSLHERLKKPISKYEFWFIMEQIVDTVQRINAESLIISNIEFDIKNVYINEITKGLQFLYLPLENKQKEANILLFLEQIIYASQPMQEADTNYISRFSCFIKSLKKFDPDQVERYIQKEDRSVVNIIKGYNVSQSGYVKDMNHGIDGEEDEATDILDEAATGLLSEEAEEATGLLVEDQQPNHFASLYRCLTDEMIIINKPVFRIGKEKSYSDYFVANNDKVSRSHADIITRGEKYFIEDLNSKNKTFVNGCVIPAQQEVEIHYGDKIRIANEDFEFQS